jgi:hypothetical protein
MHKGLPFHDPARLSRRRFIKTAGVGVTLPLLPSLLYTRNAPALSCTPAPVKRFVAYMFPNGHKLDEHVPADAGSGAGWSLPPMLHSMQDLKSDLVFVSGLENQQRRRAFGDHAIGCGSMLTARMPTADQQVSNTSVDQIIADAVGCAGIHSLQLGTHNAGPSDSFGNYYTRSVSWRATTVDNGNGTFSFPAGPATPLGKEIDPRKVFDRLFQGTDPQQSSAEAEMRQVLRKSVLDLVTAQANGLSGRLNAPDRIKLDELFTGIRELEKGMQASAPLVCTPPDAPQAGMSFQNQLGFMHELMGIALQCDATRVITFMMGDALNNRNLGFIAEVAALGGDAGDHSVSHHSGNANLVAKFRAMVLWKMEQIASFVRRLRTMQDASGAPLLDSTLVFISSELADGNRHNHDNLPILLAGKLGGLVTTDRHVRFPTSRDFTQVKTHGDFFMTLMSLYGIKATGFGNDGVEEIQWQA